MKILFINSVYGFGSTGKIVSYLASSAKYDSLVCYGRKINENNEKLYKFSNVIDNSIAVIRTIVFDNNLTLCKKSTERLIKKINEFNPDIIHLHNIHGYYVNVELLFNYLHACKKPVVWTFHDCWPFTGYCAFYDIPKCNKFKSNCYNCPKKFSYPFSLFKQRAIKEYRRKEELFNSLDNLTIVTPSNWLKKEVKKSFLKNINVEVINNGIKLPTDLKQSKKKNNHLSIIAVANYWTEEKGINELRKIIPLLDDDINITIVGEIKNKKGFSRCKLIPRTDSYEELEVLYQDNDIFINPTLSDNFPTVNIEALAHGLPIITYNTGGSPEVIDNFTGKVVEKFNYEEFASVINSLKDNNYFKKEDCFERAQKFGLENMMEEYQKIYEQLCQ